METKDMLTQMRSLTASVMNKLAKFENDSLYETEEKLAMLSAINSGDVEQVRELHSTGFDFSKERGFSLTYAAHYNLVDITRFLVEEANVSLSVDDFAPLRDAVMMKSNDVAEYLLTQPLTQDIRAMALSEAAQHGNRDVTEFLLMNFDFKPEQTRLAFKCAAMNERKPVATFIYANAAHIERESIDELLEDWAKAYEGTSIKPEYSVERLRAEMEDIKVIKRGLGAVLSGKGSTSKGLGR
jgi:hypothetical protein